MNYTIEDIVKNDLCIGCGICISESSNSSMKWNEYGFLVPDINKKFNERAIKVCPFNPNPEPAVADEDKLAEIFLGNAPEKDGDIGHFYKIYVGYSKKHRKTSSSGGIGTYLLEQLLEQRIVNHLFVVKEINGEYGYQWISDAKEIKQASKTRYIPVTLERLFLEIDQKSGSVAVSGIPPFLKAIRLKQYYYPEYREKIKFLIGIICGGWKSRFFTDYLAQKAGVTGFYSHQEYRIKDEHSFALDYSFGALDQENNFHQMKMKEAGNMWGTGLFNANASDFSDDVTAELGDVSLGDAWINPYMKDGRGTSLFVTRTEIADKIIQDGIESKELDLEELGLKEFISSQVGAFRHRRIGMKFRLKELRKSGSILPYKRERLLENPPLEYAIVLKQRRKLRKASLKIWAETRKAQEFDIKLKRLKEGLDTRTLWYHRIQIIRKKLGKRTI